MAMAQQSEGESDKELWLTLAQSWVRLAEHVERVAENPDLSPEGDDVAEAENVLEFRPAEQK